MAYACRVLWRQGNKVHLSYAKGEIGHVRLLNSTTLIKAYHAASFCLLVTVASAAYLLSFLGTGCQSLWRPAVRQRSAALSTQSSQLQPVLCSQRGSEAASSPVPSRGQQTSAAVAHEEVGGSNKPGTTGGRLSNAAEFALATVDDIVNWARKVNCIIMWFCYVSMTTDWMILYCNYNFNNDVLH